MLFYVARDEGNVTGPHPVGVIRRGFTTGEFSYDTQVCLHGTEDWLPLADWTHDLGLEEKPQPVAQLAHIKYASVLESTEKKSAFKIFWSLVCIVIGVLQTAFAVLTFGNFEIWISLLVLGIGLLWGVGGVSELIRQSKKK